MSTYVGDITLLSEVETSAEIVKSLKPRIYVAIAKFYIFICNYISYFNLLSLNNLFYFVACSITPNYFVNFNYSKQSNSLMIKG